MLHTIAIRYLLPLLKKIIETSCEKFMLFMLCLVSLETRPSTPTCV